ncbi:MAG: thymidine phosphorylase [Candidatus Gastranaerophilales bacterium]|nr:thymidine phosphorylase [Candidatus Gastranaerophilales bacterium]
MKITDLISKKKHGLEHSKEEIDFLIRGILSNSIPDYQLSAWLMAVYFRGLNTDETTYLTYAMANSGDVLDLSEFGENTVDKHSTGGVGDKITLILLPLLAQAGLPVAKLSGRSLGHTGGTIDKLDSIQGFDTSLPINKFLEQVKKIGVAIAGQTVELAPADGKLYAMRDVTATVDSMGLIASSVVSKKIAAGAKIIILDVKYGSGAFIKTKEEALELSMLMKEVAKRLGRNLICAITSMEEPLGLAIGNSLEIQEAIDTLLGKGPKDTTELTLHLGAIALTEAKKAKSAKEAYELLEKSLNDGSAYRKFEELIKAQGGNLDNGLPKAKYQIPVTAKKSGYIKNADALTIAKAAKSLGAGRDRKEDPIDYSVGVVLNKKTGDKIDQGEILATLHSNTQNTQEIAEQICTAFEISNEKPEKEPLIYKII